VLKKAGIILAATTAGVLALSPLAFAGDKGHDADKHYGKDDKGHSRVVENDVNRDNISNDCQFGNTTGDTNQGVFGGSSLLGVLSPVTGIVANAPIQNNLLNCTNVNVEDVVDLNSNNSDTSVQRTWIDDSFNGGRGGPRP
jgi:hypothetical protein